MPKAFVCDVCGFQSVPFTMPTFDAIRAARFDGWLIDDFSPTGSRIVCPTCVAKGLRP